MTKKIAWAVAVCFLVSCPLAAQVTTTTIYGAVSDRSGAVIPGARVTATNTGTSLSRTVETNGEGQYRIDLLPVGQYTVEVSANGFAKFVRQGIDLTINQTALVDVTLQVGSVSQTVSVTAAPPMVNTSNPTIGRTVENVEITNLPIVNRNVYTLLSLTPGVQSSANDIVLGYPEQRTMINGGVNGGAGSVTYFLDGGVNMTGLRNTGNILPNPDAIQEFRVDTNNYSAAYGRFSAGVVNVITKSGTNQFHGSVFEFVRNNIFDANIWDSFAAKPPLHRNQFGGTFGGPIRKNRTFFFFSYQGLRQSTPNFVNGVIVPTVAERTGDFSGDKPIADPYAAGLPQFKGNIIPSGLLDRTAINIINKYVPTPNSLNPKTGQDTEWQGFAPPSPYNTDDYLGKADQVLTPTQRLTASYFYTSGINNNKVGSGLPYARRIFQWRQQNANLSHTWSINPSEVNQVWVSYTRNMGGRIGLPAISLGDLGSKFEIQGPPSLPQIGVTGYFSLSNAISGPKAGTNYFAFRDLLAVNKGRHALNFGGEISHDSDIQATLLNNYGVFGFTSANTGNALADYLLGLPTSVSQDAPVTPYTNSYYFALFVQDDFRIAPRLTLNLGLRWDAQTPPTDPRDQQATFIEGVQSKVRPDAPPGVLFAGDPGIPRGIVATRWRHFSPRVGLAWDPFGDGKTSIRAGGGVFYGSVSGNEWNSSSNLEPFSTRLHFINIVEASKTKPLGPNNIGATLTDPYQNYPGGIPFPYRGQFAPGGGIDGIATDFQWPLAYQANFSVARQVGRSLSVSASYVGAFGHHLPFAVDLNYPVLNVPGVTPTTGNAPLRRPVDNPNIGLPPGSAFGAISIVQSNQNTSYNGLQIDVVKRMSHGLTLNSWYVYSKTLETVRLTNDTTGGGTQDYNKLYLEAARSENDIRHMFVTSLVWQPAYYHGSHAAVRAVLNGWGISPIITLQSGAPITLTTGKDNNLDGDSGDDRPDRVPGVTATLDPGRPRGAVIKDWFNTAAFTSNAVGTDGNAGRNILDGPGFRNVNLGIFRDFKFKERYTLQFRAESTNAFNMVSLDSPGETLSSSNFGVITGAQGMREIQLGLRLAF